MFGQRFSSGATISAIRSESASSSTISRPWNRPTTSAVRSSAVGPRPPLVITRSSPCAAMNSSAAQHVLGPVADDRRVGQLDAELEQPPGQPGAVAVADPPGQDLCAGHDDSRAGRSRPAHLQVGSCPAGERPAAMGLCDRVADRLGGGRDDPRYAVEVHRHRVVAERDFKVLGMVGRRRFARPAVRGPGSACGRLRRAGRHRSARSASAAARLALRRAGVGVPDGRGRGCDRALLDRRLRGCRGGVFGGGASCREQDDERPLSAARPRPTAIV